MTPKIKEFAEKMYPHNSNVPPRPVLIEGILIGAEFAEWAIKNVNQINTFKDDTIHYYLVGRGGHFASITELLDIFITEKMKENESKNN